MLHLTIYLLHRESSRRRNKLIKAVRWLPQFITAQIWQHYLVLNTLSYLHAFKFSTVNNFDLKQEPNGHCLSNNCMSKKWKNKLNKSKPPKLVLLIFTFSRILLTSSIQQYRKLTLSFVRHGTARTPGDYRTKFHTGRLLPEGEQGWRSG